MKKNGGLSLDCPINTCVLRWTNNIFIIITVLFLILLFLLLLFLILLFLLLNETCEEDSCWVDGVEGGVGEGEQVLHPPQVSPLGHVQVTGGDSTPNQTFLTYFLDLTLGIALEDSTRRKHNDLKMTK